MTKKTVKKQTKKQEPEKQEVLAQLELCPNYCPFLKQEAFYCRLFNMQLMASPPLVYKCIECMNSDVRKSAYKKRVKELEKRTYMWDKALKKTHFDIRETIRTTLRDWKDRKIFKEFLMSMAGHLPIFLDKKLSKLLMNLYLVLDATEKQMMKNILADPKTAEILVKKIKTVGRSPDLLKLVRKEMDDITYQKQQKEMEELLLKQRANQIGR